MGSGGGTWDEKDRITKDRLNQKTLLIDSGANVPASPLTGQEFRCTTTSGNFVSGNKYYYDGANWKALLIFKGTGAQIAALVTNSMTEAGLIAICTSSGSGYTAGFIYRRNAANSAWEPFIATNGVVFPTAVSSDYAAVSSTSNSASSTNSATTTVNMDTSATTTISASRLDTDVTRVGEKITDTALRNRVIKSVTFHLSESGSPTGAVSCKIRKTSDDSVVATANETPDASTIAADTNVTFNFPANTITPNEDFYILVEFEDGSGTDYIELNSSASSTYAGGVYVYYAVSYTVDANRDARGSMAFATFEPYYLSDDSTDSTYYWKSNSEANPYAQVDLQSSRLVSGCRIFWLTAGRPTTYKLQHSTDGSSWTDIPGESFTSQPTADAYTEYAFNTVLARYIRVQAQETIAMEITEIQAYFKATDAAIASHGHGDTLT